MINAFRSSFNISAVVGFASPNIKVWDDYSFHEVADSFVFLF